MVYYGCLGFGVKDLEAPGMEIKIETGNSFNALM